ncbi:MAG TPA: hypothetical protein VGO45_12675 [Bacteroidia bacterium]|jgi:hypothetical protein|nr:hypothetical protein [Bacteroidia bacterium]
MKKTKLLLAAFTAVLFIGFSVSSCKKSSSPSPTPSPAEETQTTLDNSNAEHTVSDITEMASQASDGTASLGAYRTDANDQVCGLSCATITRDTVNKTVVITFNGSAPCLDGHTRSGSITVNYSASTGGAKHYRDPGFSCSITSNNYIVDGNQVNIINKTVTNTTQPGFNPMSTNLTWSVNAHVTIVKASGGTIDWTCLRTKTLLNTSDTTVYHGPFHPISWNKARVGNIGSASGTTTSGIAFTVNITNLLIRDFGGCNINGKHPIIQGTLQFTPSGHPVRTLDYGNGSCDLLATVTVNGVTTTITIN